MARLNPPGGSCQGGEPTQQQEQAPLPLALLLRAPRGKGGVLPQPEAIEEGATHQGNGALTLCDQGSVLLPRCGRGLQSGLVVRLVQHVQIQFQWSLWIQAKQVARTLQMAVLGSRGVRVDEESAQGYKSAAQGGAPLLGPTVRPQEGGQLAAGVHAAFDRQVEQQGLGLAQGKGEAAAITKYFWWAEHGQS